MSARLEALAEARRLVVQEGLSYGEAAEATGVPLSTIQKRASAERWQEERDVQGSYTAQIRALKAGLLQKAMTAMADGTDPTQIVFAWKQAEAVYPEHRYNRATTAPDPKAQLAIGVQVLEALVEYLGEHDRNALAAVQPHLRAVAQLVEARLAG